METLKITNPIRQICLLLAFSGLSTGVVAQDQQIDQVVDTGVERTEAAAASQERIDSTQSEIDRIVSNYKRQLKVIDGLKVYNSLLQRQLDAQWRQFFHVHTERELQRHG